MRRAVLLVVTTLAVLASAASARADATPVQLVLLYMPNVSTTGTTSASGIAELVMPEGEVRISTADLPRLDGDQQYVAWLVNTSTNEFQRLGAFNTAQSTGAARYETVLPDAIPNKHWNLFLVTVERSATPDRPSAKHSIAGVFPSADARELPGALPNTGGDPDEPSAVSVQLSAAERADWLHSSGLATLLLPITFGAGYVVGRRRPARLHHP
jgi:hypothetical protein